MYAQSQPHWTRFLDCSLDKPSIHFCLSTPRPFSRAIQLTRALLRRKTFSSENCFTGGTRLCTSERSTFSRLTQRCALRWLHRSLRFSHRWTRRPVKYWTQSTRLLKPRDVPEKQERARSQLVLNAVSCGRPVAVVIDSEWGARGGVVGVMAIFRQQRA